MTKQLLASLLCVVSVFWSSNAAAAADSVCPQAPCVYLPTIAVPPPLKVTGYYAGDWRSGGRDGQFYYVIRGHVINRSYQPIYQAFVRISGVNSGGFLVTQTVPLALPVTFPGQLNPFEASYLSGYQAPSPPVFDIVGGTPTGSFQSITVVTSRTVSSGIEVTFRNDGLAPVKDVAGDLGLTTEGVSYIDFSQVYPAYPITNLMNPGATVIFTFPIRPGLAQKWVVFAQGTTCSTPPLCP